MKHLRSFRIGWPLVLLTVALLASASTPITNGAAYYYQAGAMDTLGSWNSNRDGSGLAPLAFTGNSFVVQNTQTPTASASWTSSTGPGTILVETGGTILATANPAISLSMQSGANYQMNSPATDYSALTFVTVDPASTFTVNNANLSPLDKPYGNFVWKLSMIKSPVGNLTTTGSLTIQSGQQLRVGNGTANQTWTIGGDLLIKPTGSKLNFTNNAANGVAVNLSGSLINTSEIIKTGAGSSSMSFVGSAPASATWGLVTNSASFINLTFNVGNVDGSSKAVTFIDSLNEGLATFTVRNGGTLNLGSNVLSGSAVAGAAGTGGTFNLNAGGTIITSNPIGLDGAINTLNKTFDSAANYEFRGAATGTTLPSTVNNLTINRTSGNVDLQGAGSTQTVSNALKVMSGNLNANGSRTQINVGGNGDAVVMSGGSQINSNATVVMTGTGGVVFDTTNSGTATIAGTLNLGATTRSFNVANGAADVDMDVSGQLTNGVISKSGAGTLRISAGQGFNNLTPININGGTLQADNPTGSATGNANVIVNGDGTLSGSGSVAGSVTVNGTAGHNGKLSPGASIESLSSGSVTLNPDSRFVYEINSTAVTADLLNAMTGSLTIATGGAGVALELHDLLPSGSKLAYGTKFTLISYDGTWNGGTFVGAPNLGNVTLGLNQFLISYTDENAGGNFATETALNTSGRFVTLTAVPELGSFITMGLVGCCVLGAIRLGKRYGLKVFSV